MPCDLVWCVVQAFFEVLWIPYWGGCWCGWVDPPELTSLPPAVGYVMSG